MLTPGLPNRKHMLIVGAWRDFAAHLINNHADPYGASEALSFDLGGARL